MNKRLILSNFLYYSILLLFYQQARADASSSLGVGILAMIFIFAAAVTVCILFITKTLYIKNNWDRLGTFMLTPVPVFAVAMTLGSLAETRSGAGSSWHFTVGKFRYKAEYYHYPTGSQKRIEYYRNMDTVSENAPFPDSGEWEEDSIWLYFSEKGDTLKKERHPLQKD